MAGDYTKPENIFAIISAVNEVLSVSNEPQQLLEMFLDTLSEVLKIDCCWIQLIDSESRKLSLAAYRGFTPDMEREISSLDPGWNHSNQIVGIGYKVIIPDLTRDREHSFLSFRRGGIHWLVAVPVRTYRVQGILGIASRTKKQFSNEIADLLMVIAGQLGLATDKANLFQRTINNNNKLGYNSGQHETPHPDNSDIPRDLITGLEHFAQEWVTATDKAGKAAEQLSQLTSPSQVELSPLPQQTPEIAEEVKTTDKIRVHVIDRDSFFLKGLSLYLAQTDDIEISGQSNDLTDDVGLLFKESIPDIVVVDADLPTMSGFDLARRITEYWTDVSVIILTPYLDDDQIFEVLRSGVSGYVNKNIDGNRIADAIRAVFRGEGTVNNFLYRPGVARRVLQQLQHRDRQDQPEPVSPQELAVLEYLASGHSIKQAHTMLGISQQEIEADTIAIIAKLTAAVDA